MCKYIEVNQKRYANGITVFETGTARGFSSICMAKALIDKDWKGFIVSVDIISHNEKMYWNCIDDNDGPSTRSELLSDWRKELSKIIFIQGWSKEILSRIGLEHINFAFIDAEHSKEAVLKEFKYVSERQVKGDIIIFDDVSMDIYDGVCQAVKIIKNNGSYNIEYINFLDNRGYAIAKRIN